MRAFSTNVPLGAAARAAAMRSTASAGGSVRAVLEVMADVVFPASNERGDLFLEVKQALLVARARGGPKAMNAREALRLGTQGGAAVLGSIQPQPIPQAADEFVVDGAVNDEPRGCGAALARGAERRPDDALDGQVEIRIVHDDDRVLAA